VQYARTALYPVEAALEGPLLIALYSVRSDRLFCEMLDYNILFRERLLLLLPMILETRRSTSRGRAVPIRRIRARPTKKPV